MRDVPQSEIAALSVRTRHALEAMGGTWTFERVADLTEERILRVRNAGKKTVAELMVFKDRMGELAKHPELLVPKPIEEVRPSPSEFASLEELVVRMTAAQMRVPEQYVAVMRLNMGLLNVTERKNLEESGAVLGVTRERVRQIAKKIAEKLFANPNDKPWSEILSAVRGIFVSHGLEMPRSEVEAEIDAAFGWQGTTAFSLQQLLAYLGIEIIELPEGRGYGWNETGKFDWVKTYRPPTLTVRRRTAIKKILTDAGFEGLTVDEIRMICSRNYPDLKIGEGNIRGAMNDMLDDEGTHIIPYDRGTRLNGGTRYSLNSFFRDAKTRAVLEKAAKRICAYMEKTGLGVVSVWKASQEHRLELPHPLPKLGFYMMMRDFKSGGLVYPDYPRIAYPGIRVGENTFPWMLYMYCMICRRPKATFAEIMYFFTECLGLQPSIACACSFASMGLKKVEEDASASYAVKPPAEGVKPPALFLPAIRKYQDFSLIQVPAKASISGYYLDEDGRALTHGAYAKIFFRALEEKKFAFPSAELAGLLDKGWCKRMLKAYRPVLRRTGGLARPSVFGYWREVFRFGDEEYFISDDWEPRNKAQFDAWAARIAALANIRFVPYDIKGLGADALPD